MNITEQLLFLHSNFVPAAPWSMVRPDIVPFSPCAVPFESSQADLQVARDYYSRNELAQAKQFIHLCRAQHACHSSEYWHLSLIEAVLWLEQGCPHEAWQILQQALACQTPQADNNLATVTLRDLLAMATIALGHNKLQDAEQFASEAVKRVQQDRTCGLQDVLCDSRADAMTVFAVLRLSQSRFREAEMLLELAYDAHTQAGDLEQMAVDLLLMADVELYSGSQQASCLLLTECEEILRENCDKSRHLRTMQLQLATEQRLHHIQVAHRCSTKVCLN